MREGEDFEEYQDDDFEIVIDPEDPVYTLNVVCKLLDMNYWTVHEILEEGLLKPKLVGKRKKLFSLKDIKRLKYIKYLIEVKGVNINGIKIIMEIKGDIF